MDEIGLKAAGGTDSEKYPYLARSLANVLPANSSTVEWDVDGPEGRVGWFNFTEIHRTPFGVSRCATGSYRNAWEEFKTAKLAEHLVGIERSLKHGRLSRSFSWHIDRETGELYQVEHRTMGGALFYLGREADEDDSLTLRVLRDTIFRDTTAPDLDGYEGEFLTEFSLQVVPAKITAAIAA